MQTIDYSKYSYHELHEALSSIDKESFPDNYQAIINEIEKRKSSGHVATYNHKELPYYAGFWRRIFAHMVDCLLLSLPLFLIGSFIFDSLVTLGNYGALIGFILSAAYFTLGYSHLFGGQTVGKAFIDIKVIDRQGGELSLSKAFIRYLILDFPYYLLPMLLIWFRPDGLLSFTLTLLGTIILLTSIYLLIFNRPTRRTVHDYAAGSMVVNLDIDHQAHKPFWKGHYFIWSPIAMLLVILSIGSYISKQEVRVSLSPLKQAIESQTTYQVKQLDVNVATHPAMKQTTFKTLVAYVHSSESNVDLEDMSDEITSIIKQHPDAASYNSIYLITSTGFNLGIAYSTKQHTSFTQL